MTSNGKGSSNAVVTAAWGALHQIPMSKPVEVIVASEDHSTVRSGRGRVLERITFFSPKRLTVTGDLATAFRQLVYDAVPTPQNTQLIRYDPGYLPTAGELQYLPLAEVPDVAAFVETLLQLAPDDVFVDEKDVVRRLKVYAVMVGGSNDPAVFIRHFGRNKTLGRNKLFTVLRKDGVYDRLEDAVLVFDDQVDCVAWAGYLFVQNARAFRALFQQFVELRERARAASERIVHCVPIANAPEFIEACTNHMQLGEKAYQVSLQAYLGTITVAQLMDINERFDVGVDVDSSTGTARLIFDRSPGGRWKILKLLDDDFLDSPLTEIRYEVNSKMAR